MGRAKRDEWERRIQRWTDSGLTAKEFAAETGLNAHTLTHWKWRLAADARSASQPAAKFVEVVQAVPPRAARSSSPSTEMAFFEVFFGDGRRLRVPPQFEASSLQTLLELMGGR